MKALSIILACCLCLGIQVHAAPSQFKHMQKGVTCEMCHNSAQPVTKAKAKSCAKCHKYEDLAQKSAKLNPNPHDSHAGQLRCTLCHREHEQSVVYCKECHKNDDPKFNFNVP